jgi:hypothetical protein
MGRLECSGVETKAGITGEIWCTKRLFEQRNRPQLLELEFPFISPYTQLHVLVSLAAEVSSASKPLLCENRDGPAGPSFISVQATNAWCTCSSGIFANALAKSGRTTS